MYTVQYGIHVALIYVTGTQLKSWEKVATWLFDFHSGPLPCLALRPTNYVIVHFGTFKSFKYQVL